MVVGELCFRRDCTSTCWLCGALHVLFGVGGSVVFVVKWLNVMRLGFYCIVDFLLPCRACGLVGIGDGGLVSLLLGW